MEGGPQNQLFHTKRPLQEDTSATKTSHFWYFWFSLTAVDVYCSGLISSVSSYTFSDKVLVTYRYVQNGKVSLVHVYTGVCSFVHAQRYAHLVVMVDEPSMM